MTRKLATTIAFVLIVAACGGGDDESAATTAPASTTEATTTTVAETTTTTAAPATTTTTEAPAVTTDYSAFMAVLPDVGGCANVTYLESGEEADFGIPPNPVDCSEPHDHEVFYRGEYPAAAGDSYPVEDTFFEVVFDEVCIETQDTRVGPYDEHALGVWGYWPDEESWAAGERAVACTFASIDNEIDGTQLIGPAMGTDIKFPGHLMAGLAEFEDLDLWLYILGPDGETLDSVNVTADGWDLEEEQAPPGWSPDLSTLAYAAREEGQENDLYLLDLATAEKTRLTETPDSNEGGAAFSPDGTKILYSAAGAEGELDLFVMDTDGSNVVQLTDHPDRDSSGDWSPDGSQIVFRRRTDGQSDIWLMNADGSDQRFFRGDAGSNEYDPDWSPDGGSIVYISDASGSFDLLDAPLVGDGSTQLTSDAADDEYPEWSPDGEYIVFHSNRYGYTGLFVMPADGSTIAPLLWDYPIGYVQLRFPAE